MIHTPLVSGMATLHHAAARTMFSRYGVHVSDCATSAEGVRFINDTVRYRPRSACGSTQKISTTLAPQWSLAPACTEIAPPTLLSTSPASMGHHVLPHIITAGSPRLVTAADTCSWAIRAWIRFCGKLFGQLVAQHDIDVQDHATMMLLNHTPLA